MQIPFDPQKQPKEYAFFSQMTENIDRWMTQKYPGFDTLLTGKITRLQEIQNELELSFKKLKKTIDDTNKSSLIWFKTEMKVYMATEYPDVSKKLFSMASKLETDMKNQIKSSKEIREEFDKKIKEIDKHLSNTKIYNTLCEDVYRLRDQMEVMQQEVSEFTQKLRKAFE